MVGEFEDEEIAPLLFSHAGESIRPSLSIQMLKALSLFGFVGPTMSWRSVEHKACMPVRAAARR